MEHAGAAEPSGRGTAGGPAAHAVVVLAYDGAELTDIACATSVLDLTNRWRAARWSYDVVLASPSGGDIRCGAGPTLRAQASIADVDRCDTLLVTGGDGHARVAADPTLVHHVRRLARGARRVASLSTGATLLAASGLLDGVRATTHWRHAGELARRFPSVRVDPEPVFVRIGKWATSAGRLATVDLALSLVEEDHGTELASRVAMGMVAYLQRPGEQHQLGPLTRAPRTDQVVVRRVLDHIAAAPQADLSLDALAAVVSLSPRHLSRLFRDHVGETPTAVVRRVRLELAEQLLCATGAPLTDVARHCGFASVESLRQAFTAKHGVSPRAFRSDQDEGGRRVPRPRRAETRPRLAARAWRDE